MKTTLRIKLVVIATIGAAVVVAAVDGLYKSNTISTLEELDEYAYHLRNHNATTHTNNGTTWRAYVVPPEVLMLPYYRAASRQPHINAQREILEGIVESASNYTYIALEIASSIEQGNYIHPDVLPGTESYRSVANILHFGLSEHVKLVLKDGRNLDVIDQRLETALNSLGIRRLILVFPGTGQGINISEVDKSELVLKEFGLGTGPVTLLLRQPPRTNVETTAFSTHLTEG